MLIRIRNPSRTEATLLAVVGLVLFIIVVGLGVADYRRRDLEINVVLLALAAVVGTPVVLLANAAELTLVGRLVDVRLPYRTSLVTSVTASAANILPLPGSVLVRSWVLNRGGASVRQVVGATAMAGVAWLVATFSLTGLAAVVGGFPAGWLLLAAAAAGMVPLRLMVNRTGHGHPLTVAALFGVEVTTVLAELGRYWVVLAALGVDSDLTIVSALVLANVLATATGLFPGGLGVRELIAGLLGSFISLPAGVAITASASDRIATSIVLGVILLGVGLSKGTLHLDSQIRGEVADA